ncbi:MAG: hypothetical protein IPI35_03730 [Deltaproteobacteria bacterium]|nr:hypothetical protein [Deltaproteobacteria bacterium]
MSVPDLAKPAYQRLVSAPLGDTKALKRELAAARAGLLNGANVHLAVAEQAIGVAAALIDAVERKTSPLYVRHIHAAARYVMTEGPGDWPLALEVVNATAYGVQRRELATAPPKG